MNVINTMLLPTKFIRIPVLSTIKMILVVFLKLLTQLYVFLFWNLNFQVFLWNLNHHHRNQTHHLNHVFSFSKTISILHITNVNDKTVPLHQISINLEELLPVSDTAFNTMHNGVHGYPSDSNNIRNNINNYQNVINARHTKLISGASPNLNANHDLAQDFYSILNTTITIKDTRKLSQFYYLYHNYMTKVQQNIVCCPINANQIQRYVEINSSSPHNATLSIFTHFGFGLSPSIISLVIKFDMLHYAPLQTNILLQWNIHSLLSSVTRIILVNVKTLSSAASHDLLLQSRYFSRYFTPTIILAIKQ